MAVSRDLLLKFFEKMLLIRRFEETLFDLAKRGIVKGSVHLCNGQEAPAVAACYAVDREDFMMPTHRGHGQILAKGADPGRFLAELLGRADGYCGGRVGSMHTFDKETNNVGSNGIVGGQFPIAAGIGLGIKLMELDRCFLLFFGDGSTNQGWFYELLNLAGLWNLPIMFVCVNNKYGMGTHYDRTSNISVSGKAELFHIPARQANGNDVEEVYETIVPLVAQVKQEKRPVFLECATYRMSGHSAFDTRPYRPKKEIEEWKKNDPILLAEKKLLSMKCEKKKIQETRVKVDALMKEAEKFALASAYPEFEPALEQ